jgi:hypothetical protein
LHHRNSSGLYRTKASPIEWVNENRQVTNLEVNGGKVDLNHLVKSILLAIFYIPRVSDRPTFWPQLIVVNGIYNSSHLIDQNDGSIKVDSLPSEEVPREPDTQLRVLHVQYYMLILLHIFFCV